MKPEPGKPLDPQQLRWRCDTSKFEFESTAELSELKDIPGQDRAVEAIYFATEIDVDGHNVYVLGPSGSGRHDFVRNFLQKKAASEAVPSDWCYVFNFEDPRKPRVIALPPGRSRDFQRDVEQVIEDAQTAIPAAFESEDFQNQRESITEEFKQVQEQAFQQVEEEARAHEIGVVQTPAGVAFIPLKDGEAMGSEDFKKLPEAEQEQFHEQINSLTHKLQQAMRTIPKQAREMRQKIRQLERDVAGLALTGLIEELVQKYQDLPAVVEHLRRMETDIIENVGTFLRPSDGQGVPVVQLQQMMESKESAAMRRYAINVFVEHGGDSGAPVVFEDKPNFMELIGRVEHESEFGSLITSFSLIRSGSLHRANGGYLVIDAVKLLSYPQAWEGLKRALKSRELKIRTLSDEYGLISTVTLEPEPIPLDLKVILIGERIYYYLLQKYDPEFRELFKVAADFEDQIPRSDQNVKSLSRWLATVAREEGLLPVHRDGIARLMEDSARHVGDSERLSADIRRASDLLREAHFWAKQDQSPLIGAREVQKAIDSRVRRSSRYRDRMQEEMLRETFVVDTDGATVGEINGLAVLQVGEFAFGRPQRISATIRLGSGEVVDIEREVKLGGPLHSKGVLILSSFMASHYLTDRPLSLSASLVFEQSYGGVDGDSASAAELCALASALSGVPIRHSLAITGSVDQRGRVQAIGGVSEKIEGFFDLCRERGLTGEQGVLIPFANVKHLMLRQDVVDAVADGKFRVYPVNHVDQALELLTGVPAGARLDEGGFEEGSINQKVREKLIELADKRRAFGKASEADAGEEDAPDKA
jgi:lon-related putative ATP-dependent protease